MVSFMLIGKKKRQFDNARGTILRELMELFMDLETLLIAARKMHTHPGLEICALYKVAAQTLWSKEEQKEK